MSCVAMSPRERLEAVFAGREPDRTPILGGWIACPAHIQALTGAGEEEYWADPVGVSIRAYQALGDDGLIAVFVPRTRQDYRCVDADSYLRAEATQSLEQALQRIDAMPTAEEVEARFDFAAEYARFRQELVDMQARCGEMVWMPAQWGGGARITWYGEFGY